MDVEYFYIQTRIGFCLSLCVGYSMVSISVGLVTTRLVCGIKWSWKKMVSICRQRILYVEWPNKLSTIGSSLAVVDFSCRIFVEGVSGDNYKGTGVVVSDGLLAVDRDTVPVALGMYLWLLQVLFVSRHKWNGYIHSIIGTGSVCSSLVSGVKPVDLRKMPKKGIRFPAANEIKSEMVSGKNWARR